MKSFLVYYNYSDFCSVRFLNFVICKNMSRLFWVFVLLAVIALPLCNARPHKCEQRERSLADLDLAEDSLNRAKQLYPDCEDESEISNSSECSKKDKSLGFIDVALELVSNAKKNIPICPHVPTEEPLTTTVEPLSTKGETTPQVTTENISAMDCQELLAAGHTTSGVYSVWPKGGKSAVRVRCDMDTDGGGWTVIQRRGNFSQQEDFYRNWKDYKNGFGNLERDFWLGNDNIFALTNQGKYSLRMDMTAADGDSAYALFQNFRIEDENANYKLHVGGYRGTAGSSLTQNDGHTFSTKDRETDKYRSNACVVGLNGGFWYNDCNSCNPNGLYLPGKKSYSSMHYNPGFKKYEGLASMDMKLRRL